MTIDKPPNKFVSSPQRVGGSEGSLNEGEDNTQDIPSVEEERAKLVVSSPL